jgi:hypothetical protein
MQLETHSMGNLRFRMRKLVTDRVTDRVHRQVSMGTWIEFSRRIRFVTLIDIIRRGMRRAMYW